MKQYFMTVTVACLLGICRDSYLKLFLSLAPQAMILLCMQDCGASVVWHPSLPLMNSFNKTEAAIFPVLPEDFNYFLRIIYIVYTGCTSSKNCYPQHNFTSF